MSESNLWNENASTYIFVPDGGGKPSGWEREYTFSQIALWQNQTGNDMDHIAGIDANPAWKNRDAGDYQITSQESDAINNGSVITEPPEASVDTNGHTRDSQPDIGPYEYVNGSRPSPPTGLNILL